MVKTVVCGFVSAVSVAATLSAQGAKQPLPGLDVTVTKIERSPTASLRDCPPGANTVNATTRPGEQFALVTVAFKVGSSFKPAAMKRPSITDAADKKFNTAATFVDVGSVPEFSCTFPFRVPEGTKLKALQIENTSYDLSSLDSK